jgi:AAA+ ATPase superfamily predicted ATPase
MNPYQNRGPIAWPEDFIGREAQLAELRSLIAKGICVSLVGERRVGKSSIMNMIKFEHDGTDPSAADYICLLVNCQFFNDATEEQVVGFIHDRFEDAFDVTAPTPSLHTLVDVAKQALRKYSARRLVVLLDEIDQLAANTKIKPQFFGFLRSWSQDFSVVLVSASKENSIESVLWNDSAGSPFWNIFKTMYVGPFTEQEALSLVREPAEEQGHPFSAAEQELILDLGGRHPFFLQIACDHAFGAKSRSMAGGDFKAELQSGFRLEASPHMDYILRTMPDAERDALVGFVRDNVQPEDRMRLELTRKGMLLQEHNRLRPFSSVFAERAREQGGAKPGFIAQTLARYLE